MAGKVVIFDGAGTVTMKRCCAAAALPLMMGNMVVEGQKLDFRGPQDTVGKPRSRQG